MKIYTKTGDKGATSLIGGARVQKNNLRVNVYGTVDELNSFIGLSMTALAKESWLYKDLQVVQNLLFDFGADLATPDVTKANRIKSADVELLESMIDKASAELPPLTSFILPGGGLAGSYLHVARTVARRAERILIDLMEQDEVKEDHLSFINRFSDFLFVAARYANLQDNKVEHAYTSK